MGFTAGLVCGSAEKPIGIAYALDNGVDLLKAAAADSSSLGRIAKDSPVEILALPADGKLSEGFYRVRHDGKVGYVSAKATRARANFDVFKAEDGLALAQTTVRVHAHPNLSAETLSMLKEKDMVPVIARGQLTHSVGPRNSFWYKVRLPDKREGFVFGGYVVTGTKDELTAVQQGEAKIQAFARVTAESPCLFAAVEDMGTPEACDRPVKKGDLADVTAMRTIKGVKYYFLENQNVGQSDTEIPNISRWISENQCEFIPDLFEYTLRVAKENLDQGLLREANRVVGGNVNVLQASIKPIKIKQSGVERVYYETRAPQGAHGKAHILFLTRREGSIVVLGKFPAFEMPRVGLTAHYMIYEDIDGDGITEMITSRSVDEGITVDVYGFGPENLIRLMRVFDKEWAFAGPKLVVHSPYVIVYPGGPGKPQYVEPKFSDGFTTREVRVFQLSAGKFTEVDGTKLKFDPVAVAKKDGYTTERN